MANHPRVPFDLLAMTYIHAVERGYPPAATVRAKFHLSPKQWEHRRIHMGRLGWLPPGDPVHDGRARGAYDARWVAAAWAGYEAKLRERFDVVVPRQQRKAYREHSRLLRTERRQVREQVALQVTERRAAAARPSRAVLDAFLTG